MNRRSFLKSLGCLSLAPLFLITKDVEAKSVMTSDYKLKRIQLLMQMHDKGLASTETLYKEMDLCQSEEVEKLRSEVMKKMG